MPLSQGAHRSSGSDDARGCDPCSGGTQSSIPRRTRQSTVGGNGNCAAYHESLQEAEKLRQICVPCIFITEPLCSYSQGGNGCADWTKNRTEDYRNSRFISILLSEKNLIMVCSNQVRENVNAGPCEQKYHSPGLSMGFYSTFRLRCSNPQKINVKILWGRARA